MRISSAQLYNSSVGGMLDQQAQVSKLQEQLSSGKRITQASDDPIGAMQSQALTSTISQYDQYGRNMTSAQNSLELSSSTLTAVVDNIQNIRQLLVQANNGSQTDSSRAAIATELRSDLDGLMQLANTQDSSGAYIFSGTRQDQAAYVQDASGNYVYQGNDAQRSVNIGPARTVATNVTGGDIFGSGSSSLMSLVNGIASALQAPQTAATSATLQQTLADGLNGLDSAMTQVSNAQTAVGTRLNAIDQQNTINGDTSVQFKSMLSQVQDLDYAGAITQFNLQMTGLQAAQQAYTKIQGLSLFNYMQ